MKKTNTLKLLIIPIDNFYLYGHAHKMFGLDSAAKSK